MSGVEDITLHGGKEESHSFMENKAERVYSISGMNILDKLNRLSWTSRSFLLVQLKTEDQRVV